MPKKVYTCGLQSAILNKVCNIEIYGQHYRQFTLVIYSCTKIYCPDATTIYFVTCVNYTCLMFYIIGPWCPCYETFFVRNLLILVIGEGVCTWQDFQAQSNKHPSIVRKFINQGQKSFITLDPGAKKRKGKQSKPKVVGINRYKEDNEMEKGKLIEIRLECRCLQKYFHI